VWPLFGIKDMSGARRWTPENLARSLELAIALGLYEPANDNGLLLRSSESCSHSSMKESRPCKRSRGTHASERRVADRHDAPSA
jgi:hypothetical protein